MNAYMGTVKYNSNTYTSIHSIITKFNTKNIEKPHRFGTCTVCQFTQCLRQRSKMWECYGLLELFIHLQILGYSIKPK